uniref:hypothetical protein n=1 Tax=uncultured Sphingomonas sp. TaxID=158754 RepID=UPI0025EDB1F4|nr:hypothetical protein [uncultured Sphingomonas sp.]
MREQAEQAISAGKGRRLQARKPVGRAFTAAKQKTFLDSFASTCNVRMSAEAAGVDTTTVYRLRRRSQAFQHAWDAAQEQGYAALEADLVRRARELLDDIEVDDGATQRMSGMDAKLAHTMLQRHRQGMGQAPGDILPKRSDLSEATKRLEKVMRRMKLLADTPAQGTGE